MYLSTHTVRPPRAGAGRGSVCLGWVCSEGPGKDAAAGLPSRLAASGRFCPGREGVASAWGDFSQGLSWLTRALGRDLGCDLASGSPTFKTYCSGGL